MTRMGSNSKNNEAYEVVLPKASGPFVEDKIKQESPRIQSTLQSHFALLGIQMTP